MKQHEILQKIIEQEGSCEWVSNQNDGVRACDTCILARDDSISCSSVVEEMQGNFSDADYLEVARKLLLKMEVDRILLGEEIDD